MQRGVAVCLVVFLMPGTASRLPYIVQACMTQHGHVGVHIFPLDHPSNSAHHDTDVTRNGQKFLSEHLKWAKLEQPLACHRQEITFTGLSHAVYSGFVIHINALACPLLIKICALLTRFPPNCFKVSSV